MDQAEEEAIRAEAAEVNPAALETVKAVECLSKAEATALLKALQAKGIPLSELVDAMKKSQFLLRSGT